jgi:hypothetical protein
VFTLVLYIHTLLIHLHKSRQNGMTRRQIRFPEKKKQRDPYRIESRRATASLAASREPAETPPPSRRETGCAKAGTLTSGRCARVGVCACCWLCHIQHIIICNCQRHVMAQQPPTRTPSVRQRPTPAARHDRHVHRWIHGVFCVPLPSLCFEPCCQVGLRVAQYSLPHADS